FPDLPALNLIQGSGNPENQSYSSEWCVLVFLDYPVKPDNDCLMNLLLNLRIFSDSQVRKSGGCGRNILQK
ncbi:hypothetical protein KKG41_02670, partial [Patescibacteria group bacterium]|nr:hypothetical protein [Patescibacteria group bacterium]MBU1890040.1 hypothetical protein [Patescibacteria group bacterium]